jgi:phosphoribosyl-ATP pyrophosphohydrolase
MEDFFEDLKNRPRPSLYRRIRAWWVVEGKYSHKYFKIGVKNLWYWFPVIWKDRSWDHSYIYKILKHKLKKQAEFTQEKNWHTCSQQNARRMQICVKLIQSCKDDTYGIEYLDYIKERHWFEPCKDKEGYSTWESETLYENFDDFFKKYPLVYKQVMNGAGPFTLDGRDEAGLKKTIAMNIAHLNQNRAKKLLFKIMEENIERWWD